MNIALIVGNLAIPVLLTGGFVVAWVSFILFLARATVQPRARGSYIPVGVGTR